MDADGIVWNKSGALSLKVETFFEKIYFED